MSPQVKNSAQSENHMAVHNNNKKCDLQTNLYVYPVFQRGFRGAYRMHTRLNKIVGEEHVICRTEPVEPGVELHSKCIEGPHIYVEAGQKFDSKHFSNKLGKGVMWIDRICHLTTGQVQAPYLLS